MNFFTPSALPLAFQSAGAGYFQVAIFAFLAFLVFRMFMGQRNREKELKSMLSALKPGDEVVTAGGIFGEIVEMDDDTVDLLLAPDVVVTFKKRSVVGVPQEDPVGDDPEEADSALDDTTDVEDDAVDSDEDVDTDTDDEEDDENTK